MLHPSMKSAFINRVPYYIEHTFALEVTVGESAVIFHLLRCELEVSCFLTIFKSASPDALI